MNYIVLVLDLIGEWYLDFISTIWDCSFRIFFIESIKRNWKLWSKQDYYLRIQLSECYWKISIWKDTYSIFIFYKFLNLNSNKNAIEISFTQKIKGKKERKKDERRKTRNESIQLDN